LTPAHAPEQDDPSISTLQETEEVIVMQRIVPFILCSIMACTPALAANTETDFSAHWHDGRAELNGYRLEIARYGEQRAGEAVLVYVTEPFSESARVKLDDPSRHPDDAFDALKLNMVRDFQTGIYDYNTMVSLFTRSISFKPVKLTFSSAEWCGHVYDELVFRGKEVHENYFSYFEGESRSHSFVNEPEGIVEDNLYILLRGLREPFLPPGGSVHVAFLPSPFHSRLVHHAIEWEDAEIERSTGTSRTDVPAGTFETSEYVVRTDAREGRFLIETAYPHRIVQWSWARRSGAKEEWLGGTERGQLTGSVRLKYWDLHDNAHEPYRDRIGLAAKAR
jgi:hypothetical protein